MRELIQTINSWCDACGVESVQVEGATTPPITIGRRKARTLELCERHEKELLAPLLDLLTEHGADADASISIRPAAPPRPVQASLYDSSAPKSAFAKARWDCPICATNVRKSSAAAHVRGKHLKDAGLPHLDACPDCGYKSPAPQGLAAHRAHAHGYDALASYLQAWKDAQDRAHGRTKAKAPKLEPVE